MYVIYVITLYIYSKADPWTIGPRRRVPPILEYFIHIRTAVGIQTHERLNG